MKSSKIIPIRSKPARDLDSIEKLIHQIVTFRERRGWHLVHNPKDLAISISLEANELLELFQWRRTAKSLDRVEEELADILIYALTLAHDLGMDPGRAITRKLLKNGKKYPIKSS
uniref:Putative nucleotide pyrophosphohydrolase domain-containing protein n=1 Tax=viral metagenome TaxID=1070528 RepID=A0A6M3JSE6_9ZZZZ